MNQTASGPILTTEGIPLKVSLQKSERKNKIRAFLLVAPLLVFILVTFLIPIADMLVRSVDDRQINTVFPKTFEVYKKWEPWFNTGVDIMPHMPNTPKRLKRSVVADPFWWADNGAEVSERFGAWKGN